MVSRKSKHNSKSKRSQGDIITTVLIILIVLAAVVILWQVISRTTKSSSEKIDTDIMATELSVEKNSVFINKTENIAQLSIVRGNDEAVLSAIKIILEGDSKTEEYLFSDVPKMLEKKTYPVNIVGLGNIKKISVYPVSLKGAIGIAGVYEVKGSEAQVPSEGWIGDARVPGESNCTKQCGTKQCGDDSCGGVCGICETGYDCNTQSWECQQSCIPITCQSQNLQCGTYDDGCSGTISCTNRSDLSQINDGCSDDKYCNSGICQNIFIANYTFNSMPGTPFGNATIKNGKLILGGWGNVTTGVAGYVDLGNSFGNFGTNNFSVCLWFKTNITTSMEIINKYDVNSWSGWRIYTGSAGRLDFAIKDQTALILSPIVTNNNWHYACFVRQGTVILGYLDGQAPSSSSVGSASATPSANVNVYISYGNMMNRGARYFNGSIDNIRIYRRALNQQEINDSYNSEKNDFQSCTPNWQCSGWSSCINPNNQQTRTCTDSNGCGTSEGKPAESQSCTSRLVAYYNFTGNYNDNSGNGYNGNPQGGVQTQNGRLILDGDGDYVSTVDFSWKTSDSFTMSAWFNTRSTVATGVIIGKGTTADWEYSLNTGTGNDLNFNYWNTGGGGLLSLAKLDFLSANTWYFVTVTYNGTVGMLYVNGALEATDNSVLGTFQDRTNSLQIGYGYYVGGADGDFNGSIDNVRIYNRTLLQSEVSAIYNLECVDVKGSC